MTFDHPAHEGPDAGLDCADEGRVVHLEARPLVHKLGHGAAARLLVVVDPVLSVGHHLVLLDTLDYRLGTRKEVNTKHGDICDPLTLTRT